MMFEGCSSLVDISPLQDWNISKGKSFFTMFDPPVMIKSNCLFEKLRQKNSGIKDMTTLCIIF